MTDSLFFIVVQTPNGLRRIRTETMSMVNNIVPIEEVNICGVFIFHHTYFQIGGVYFCLPETTWDALRDPFDIEAFLSKLTCSST